MTRDRDPGRGAAHDHRQGDGRVERFTRNPFHVLGLAPDCSRVEVEREGQKLLHMLQLGLMSARRYASPLGPRTRDADAVRQAMAELRDPQRRLHHELWAALPPMRGAEDGSAPGPEVERDAPAPWPEALALFGWRRR